MHFKEQSSPWCEWFYSSTLSSGPDGLSSTWSILPVRASFDQLYLFTSGSTSVWISLYWVLFSYLDLPSLLFVFSWASINLSLSYLNSFRCFFFMTPSNSLNTLNIFIAVLFFILNSSFQILSKSSSLRTIIMELATEGHIVLLLFFWWNLDLWGWVIGHIFCQTLEVGCEMGTLRKIRRDRGGSQ